MSAATPVQRGREWLKSQALKLKGDEPDRRSDEAGDSRRPEASASESGAQREQAAVAAPQDASGSAALLPALQLSPERVPVLSQPSTAAREQGQGQGQNAKMRSASSPVFTTSPTPLDAPGPGTSVKPKQRPALKIRICTWNMADSIPKGDLSVLLGKVPPFVAPQGWDVEDQEVAEVEGITSGSATAAEAQPSSLRQAVVDGIQAGKAALFPNSEQNHKPTDERIPPLPLDDQHPFHIFVIAAQECPFGDAGRLATGVGMAGELGGLGRTKSKAHKEKGKGKLSKQSRDIDPKSDGQGRLDSADKSDTSAPPSLTASPRTPSVPNTGEYFGAISQANGSMDALAPLPPPAFEFQKSDRTVRGFGGKPGWSDLCENWLCSFKSGSGSKWPSGASKAASTDGVRESPAVSLLPAIPHHLLDVSKSASTSRLEESTEVMSDADLTPKAEEPNHLGAVAPTGERKEGDPAEADTANKTSHIQAAPLSPEKHPKSPRKKLQGLHLQIPTSSSKKSLLSPMSASSSTPTAKSPGFSAMARLQSNSSNMSSRAPSIAGTANPVDNTPATLGPYALVAKERMMGVYLAIYCWKGCRDLVQGSSKAYVKSGLLAGRVGNKGAVGISMKLGGARLLFVNAHLAAHEGKVATRLQNVARIKAELDCDTFLPSSDPRNMSEDVTARFDHVFWFGDLNFRIDITRQHADWLLLNKKYDQALEFDQLRKVMKDGTSTAFEGFEEAPITFPPTYKFDILSTLKKVKRSKRITKRILHRRQGSKEKLPEIEISDSLATEGTDGVPASARDGSFQSGNEAEKDMTDNAMVAAALDDDASSISSGWGSIGSLNFPYAFDTESEENLPTPAEIERSCGDGPPRVPACEGADSADCSPNAEAKAPSKEKVLIQKVKGLFTPSTEGPRAPSVEMSGRTSSGSQSGSVDPRGAVAASTPALEAAPTAEPVVKVLVEPKQASKVKSLLSVPVTKSKRSTAVASSGSNSDSESRPAGESEHRKGLGSSESKSSVAPLEGRKGGKPINESVKQVYDTSAKQRVPSWCDRVLWRSNVPVEPDDDDDDDDEGGAAAYARVRGHRRDSEGLGGRVTQALAHVFGSPFSGHTGRQRAVSVAFAAPPERGTVGVAGPLSSRARGASEDSKRAPSTINLSESDALEADEKAHIRPRISPIKRLFPSRQRRLANRLHLGLSSGAHASVSHLASGTRSSGGSGAQQDAGARQRSISVVDLREPLDAGIAARVVSGPLSAPLRPAEGGAYLSAAQTAAASGREATATSAQTPPAATEGKGASARNPLLYSRSLGGLAVPSTTDGPTSSSSPRRLSWWETHIAARLIPSLFSSSASSGEAGALAGEQDASLSAAAAARRKKLVGPRKGEVQCLDYRSLGDREMVELKARSDHRAVIWVGAIGI
ncbi:hypothetical protein OC844_002649 [Tilletia horrida]|nr:hypothetical protein OC844_002649 [Tilletia horrida]